MRVVVTGSTGLIGSGLVPRLRAEGHDVLRLVRREPSAADEVQWDPAGRRLDPAALAGVEAAVHLAGVGVGDRRWTPRYRATIRDSRVAGTTLLAQTLAGLDPLPRVLLSASAVGFYGDTQDRPVDETAPVGSGFLADVCRVWEGSTAAAQQAGIRVAHLRTGVVLSGSGGALGRQLPLFRLGLGGQLGDGRQYTSWVTLPDEVEAIRFLLTADAVRGPVNLTAPRPVTNAELTRALAGVLHRPAPWRVPAVALKVALDGLAQEALLVGQRVLPAVLEAAGFTFAHTEVEQGLAAVLGR